MSTNQEIGHDEEIVAALVPKIRAFAKIARMGAPEDTLAALSRDMQESCECRCYFEALSIGLAAETAGEFAKEAKARECEAVVIDPSSLDNPVPRVHALRMAVAIANGDDSNLTALVAAGPFSARDIDGTAALLAAQAKLLAAAVRGRVF